jgi:tRNA1(Val) A37 N6-methylase TrmN6
MKPLFQFKAFSLSDDGCGMKLSSDALLLGAYAKRPIKTIFWILDAVADYLNNKVYDINLGL